MIVVGNGESRKSVNLTLTNDVIVGCNAIHRDYKVDHLVAVDKRCVNEALSSPNCKKTTIYTRKDWHYHFDDYRVELVPELPYNGNDRADEPFHWTSGPYAILLAATLSNKIKIVGFDLYGINGLVNNVYKGTQNYNRPDYHEVDPRYWIYQISKVFELFPDKYFVIYNTKDWAMPASWKLPNVELRMLDNFVSDL